ncbi:MAG: heat-inducible transcriptional repressor HrcA [Gammaproteobacteria bacterium]|nr:heat-inducible transcriptional repressor HrcA [Gammaproteobacteria bacterium]
MPRRPNPPLSVALTNERAQALLKTLIERYIREGQPIGSRTLAKDAGMALSPATVRNVLSDLEDLGLIKAPHTSAGRIPTVRGYRLFVDSLLTIKPMRNLEVEKLRQELICDLTPEAVINTASAMLSKITGLAGVVTLPKRGSLRLEHIEFLRLSSRRILVILVVNGQEVQNRVIHTERDFSQAELQTAGNFLTAEFGGGELTQIRERLFTSMQQARDAMQSIMQNVMSITDTVLAQQQQHDYVIAGQTNLMGYAEMSDMDKLRQLFEAFHHKRDILHILDQSISAEGMQIFIGDESGYQALDECSLVTAPYKINDEVIGVLGVIGPTRMAYDRIIPIVDITAKLLSAVLKPE